MLTLQEGTGSTVDFAPPHPELGPLARWVRFLVVLTAVGPLFHAYVSVYQLLIRLGVSRLARWPGVRAIYLRRGCARDAIVPGVSDVDFAVIGEFDPPGRREELQQTYKRAVRRIPLFDRGLEVYSPAELQRLFLENDFYRYRFREGQLTWKLIYGQDFLQTLPDVPPEALWKALYSELHVWWFMLVRRLLHPRTGLIDSVARHSMAYKTIGELSRAELGLVHDEPVWSREEGYARLKPRLSAHEQTVLDALLALRRRRFVSREKSLDALAIEQGIRILDRILPSADLFHSRRAGPGLRAVVDAPKEEWLLDWRVKALFDELTLQAGPLGIGVQPAPTPWLSLDEALCVLSVPNDAVPPTETLRTLVQIFFKHRRTLSSDIHLYLRRSSGLIQLDGVDGQRGYESILIPQLSPELFRLLDPNPSVGYVVSDSLQALLIDEERMLRDQLRDSRLRKLSAHQFLRYFWKFLQLNLINRSAQTGQMIFPLTLPSLRRQASQLSMAWPPYFDDLITAFEQACAGESVELGGKVPAAVQFLEELA